jgi:hypothetical protein
MPVRGDGIISSMQPLRGTTLRSGRARRRRLPLRTFWLKVSLAEVHALATKHALDLQPTALCRRCAPKLRGPHRCSQDASIVGALIAGTATPVISRASTASQDYTRFWLTVPEVAPVRR